MFGKSKDNSTSMDEKEKIKSKTGKETSSSPSPKPFQQKPTPNLMPSINSNFQREIPSHANQIPGNSAESGRIKLDDDANRLTVGRNICLSGKITSCEKLVVDGKVEATLTDAHTIEVSPDGYFKGNATVSDAIISGTFEGTLLARNVLTVKTKGIIEGSVSYGRIIIESGGQIIGEMASIEDEKKPPNNATKNKKP